LLRLAWEESGGPMVAPPTRRGFGTTLIERGVGSDLGGSASLRFEPTGVCCEIEAPI
jgi:two-component sensor histidine kinase